MHRTILFACVVLAGAASGALLTWWELSGDQPALQSSGEPKVQVVGGPTHDFGAMHRGEKKSHTFTLKNIGSADLTLEQGETSCKCTISSLPHGLLKPGESVEVTLEWHPEAEAEQFRQTANIKTNDPNQRLVVLGIQGRVMSIVRAVPSDIGFGRIAASEPHEAEVFLFAFQDEPLAAVGPPELVDPADKDFYEVSIVPATKEELLAEKGAKSGLKLQVKVKAGLPLKRFHQKIRVTTNYKNVEPFLISVHGTSVGDISLIATQLDRGVVEDSGNLLTLADIDGASGSKIQLKLAVKGPHAGNVEFQVSKVEPEGILKATLGKAYGSGPKYVPLTVEIPPGTQAGVFTGGENGIGKIILTTTHPEVKQMELLVKFIVK